MITGLGVDIIEVERLDSALRRWGDRFLKKIFTDRELNYALARKRPAQHLAARFAAKEAFFKAFSGDVGPVSWKSIEVVNDPLGQPGIHLCEKIKKLKKSKDIKEILLSVSHTKEHAVACCFLTK
ncbi:MAG: holo-ACP synthase [Candidatus Omnitrophica bacterium]|nr:holo-ACP synthase [Candidatus Omnitrophota bacterium]MCK4422726.1 holo-ACP synthase [Candidatus Omnitrophota bacterium]